MGKLVTLGPFLFGVSLAALGAQQLLYTSFVDGPFAAPAWLPWPTALAIAVGLALTGGGLAIAAGTSIRRAASLVAAVLGLIVLTFHLPRIDGVIHDGVLRTRALETLTLCATAAMLAGLGIPTARVVFGAAMAIFGVQHFMYAPFIATLVPAWIPFPLFWTYAFGVAFIAAAVSIVANRMVLWSAGLLGVMFGLWVIVLHTPRVLADVHKANEVNSLIVALACCGASWVVATTRSRQL
jgi:uncharacterized membrane protein YphA (DoxX/SURF4 family)